MNAGWPAHYPSVQQPGPFSAKNAQNPHRPTLPHAISTQARHHAEHSAARPPALRRAETTLPANGTSDVISGAKPKSVVAEPRLMTPQLAQEFSILKIDLKMGSMHQAELVHSLEKHSVASLLDSQISKSIRHLFSLRERIEDTASKVLVTGDLNAGKSTFCNALLRRKVLPEDQQPCTSIFCEVLDSRENGGLEEVHTVPIGSIYNRNDERTYQVFPLSKLEDIVVASDRYSQCKIYIQDIRSVDESLLNNGVVDIALIDAPGLNADSLKTTALFARQEEVDVVVFVVSAANHFTASAKDFIFSAAREKAYIFMVVNGFDNIKDKARCQERILKQVAHLSPATFKESAELVHFVASNAIPVGTASSSSGDNHLVSGASSLKGASDPDTDPDGDDDDGLDGNGGDPNAGKGKGKGKASERENQRDFDELEASLRRFVLEKRARSKLAPAKTYLLNLLGDVHNLASINQEVAESERERVSKELQELEPVYEQSKQARVQAGEEADRIIEETATEVYSYTRESVDSAINGLANHNFNIRYNGFFNAYEYADCLKVAMVDEVSEIVYQCENIGREKTAHGVNVIKSLGILHLGDGYSDFIFRADKMFKRRKDALVRQVNIEID